MSKVLVTGANGFLAGNIILELLRRGYSVRGMVRKESAFRLSDDNLEPFYGNITVPSDVSQAVSGCSIIIHTAAVTDQSIADRGIYRKVNVNGTVNIINASVKHKVRKVIYVSTANAFGYGTRSLPGDETIPLKEPFNRSPYALSKTEAQKKILETLREAGPGVTVVNPTFMIGPNDFKISSNRIILRALGRRLVLIPPGGKNFIHVGDVANAVCNSINSGGNGECYILANENLTYREFYKKLADVTKKYPVLITIPGFLLLLAGIAGSLLRSAGINTPLSLTNMRILNTENFYSPGKAVRHIELPLTPVETAIRDTINWFEKSK